MLCTDFVAALRPEEDKKRGVASRSPNLWERLGASQIQASGSLVRRQAAFNPGMSESAFLSSCLVFVGTEWCVI